MHTLKLNNIVKKTKKGIDQVKHAAQDTIQKIKGNVSKNKPK